jgi:CMP-N,N'-diacetyllegionaminic acid synthase
MKKVLAIITARGGSKGLPGKNTKSFSGHPLIAWTIAHAQNTPSINKIVVSTDDPKIAKVAENYGLKVPELRPSHLASDTSSSMDVIFHVLDSEKEDFDIIVLLQPTSPIRNKDDLESMINLLKANWENADGVVSVGPFQHSPYFALEFKEGKVSSLKEFNNQRRQDMPKAYFSYGVGWAIKISALREEKSLYPKRLLGWPVKREQLFDIDDEIDFISAEATLNYVIRKNSTYLPIFKSEGPL